MSEDKTPMPETEEGIYRLLEEASQRGIIVIIGPDGMTVPEIIANMRDQKEPHRFMIIGDEPHTLPGGKNLVN